MIYKYNSFYFKNYFASKNCFSLKLLYHTKIYFAIYSTYLNAKWKGEGFNLLAYIVNYIYFTILFIQRHIE